jgi:PTS system mannitol-specific IIC component
VILSAGVTFLVASVLLRMDKGDDVGDLAGATASMEAMKGKKSLASSVLGSGRGQEIRSIVFACDAGMGSSAMGASVLRKKIQAAGHHEVTVVNKAISNLSDDVDLVVTHQDLTARAQQRTPSAIHVSVDNFMGSPRYDEIVELVEQSNNEGAASPQADAPSGGADAEVLSPGSIVLGGTATDRDAAIEEAGRLLVAAGAVDPSYVAAMHDRETSVSTFMGNGLAIPHGTNEAKGAIRRSAISFIRYDDPVDWNGKPAEFVLGIAGAGDDHLALLSRIAETFTNQDQVARLREATTPQQVLDVLQGVQV